MELLYLLKKYQKNNYIEELITETNDLDDLIDITDEYIKGKRFYKIKTRTYLHNNIETSILVDDKFNIVNFKCGCLQFYRNQECAHMILLLILGIKKIDKKYFDSIIKSFNKMSFKQKQNEILSEMIRDVKAISPYFRKIHLYADVNRIGNENFLTLRIGIDKEYIIKNITEFVEFMETNKFYSYGQKLEFTHSYEVLDDESKRLYNFIMNINDNYGKKIKLKKYQLLKLLEICKNSGLYFSKDNDKTKFYSIEEMDNLKIKLNDQLLYIDKPKDAINFICGVEGAYFVTGDKIINYRFKNRNELYIYSNLFEIEENGLSIESNRLEFISNLLPIIKNDIIIEESFYSKYELPHVIINSYFIYESGKIINEYQINIEKYSKSSTYVSQMVEGYQSILFQLGFDVNSENKFEMIDLNKQYDFLTSDISILKNFGEVFFDKTLKKITTKKTDKIIVNVKYDTGLLDFSLSSETLSIREIEKILDSYRKRKTVIKLNSDTIIKINEDDIKFVSDFLEDFNIEVKDIKNKINKPFSYLLKFINSIDDGVKFDDEIVAIINEISSYKNNNEIPRKDFIDALRPYQLDGFKWLKVLSKYGLGGILADDMGLGKTLEMITFISSDMAKKPSLIVCPTSLMYNWLNESEKWRLGVPTILISGSANEREYIIKNINQNKKALYITSYDALRRDIEFYSIKFRFIIADEAQFIKNHYALKSEAIKQLKSELRYALTGTPVENGLADLWSIFDFVMPGYLADYNNFKKRYESLIIHDDLEALDLLKKRIQPFVLRRTKKDVLKELPDKIEEIYYCKLEEKQREIYQAYVNQVRNDLKKGSGAFLTMLTRLRQICVTPELIYEDKFESSKIKLAVELINEAIFRGNRILLFTQFSSVFSIIRNELEKLKIKHFILDGSTPVIKRKELVDEFNKNENVKVFMISLKAGGTGLNLTGADVVIHLDPWWNVSVENQATDRAHRIGQRKTVSVIKLVCKDTIEEKVLNLQKIKKDLADNIIYSEENISKLSKEDILEMLE